MCTVFTFVTNSSAWCATLRVLSFRFVSSRTFDTRIKLIDESSGWAGRTGDTSIAWCATWTACYAFKWSSHGSLCINSTLFASITARGTGVVVCLSTGTFVTVFHSCSAHRRWVRTTWAVFTGIDCRRLNCVVVQTFLTQFATCLAAVVLVHASRALFTIGVSSCCPKSSQAFRARKIISLCPVVWCRCFPIGTLAAFSTTRRRCTTVRTCCTFGRVYILALCILWTLLTISVPQIICEENMSNILLSKNNNK